MEITFRVYLMSNMISLDQSMNSRSLLLGDDRSTSYLKSSFTSSRNTVWKSGDWNISTQATFYLLRTFYYFRNNLTKIPKALIGNRNRNKAIQEKVSPKWNIPVESSLSNKSTVCCNTIYWKAKIIYELIASLEENTSAQKTARGHRSKITTILDTLSLHLK